MRRILNLVQRRTLTLEEDLEFEESVQFIQGLNGIIGIKYQYTDLIESHVERGSVSSQEAAKLASELFLPVTSTYLEARRQIFTNGIVEKNYLDIKRGLLVDVGNRNITKFGTISRLTLQYVTKK